MAFSKYLVDLFPYFVPYSSLPDVYEGARGGAKLASRIILWTPQIVWALLAAGILLRRTISLRHRRQSWRHQLLPYLMIVVVIILPMIELLILPSISIVSQQAIKEAMFWEDTAPSLWALVGLAVLHAIILGLQLLRRQSPFTS